MQSVMIVEAAGRLSRMVGRVCAAAFFNSFGIASKVLRSDSTNLMVVNIAL